MPQSKNFPTLESEIKKKISRRILICIFLILTAGVFLSFFDFIQSFSQLKKTINDECKPLEDFVISQVLVPNNRSIDLKLKEFNDRNSMFQVKWEKYKTYSSEKSLRWSPPFSWLYYYPLRSIDGVGFGTFKIYGSFLNNNYFYNVLIPRMTFLFFFLSLIMFILYPLSKIIPKQLFIDPINKILFLLENSDIKRVNFNDSEFACFEVYEIRNNIINLMGLAEKRSRQIAFGELASQVAHDIRSPLAALTMITSHLVDIPEKHRNIIRSSVARINDIANNLINEYIGSKESHVTSESYPELIYLLIDSIVSEKRAQYFSGKVGIEFSHDRESMSSFVLISAGHFKRALSNLINNAVEASKENTSVLVKISRHEDEVKIEIMDTGRGMDEELVKKIVNGGVSVGKKGGVGLGVSHAINCITQWGGSYNIVSEIDRGTTFEILLPIVASPQWFLDKLTISQASSIFVVDDDAAIHSIWANRLNTLAEETKIEIKDFYKPEEFVLFYDAHPMNASCCLLLVDYEFIGSTMNGIELIEKLKLQNVVLVTSRYEDRDIRKRCETLGVKILPKSLAAFIPIEINPSVTEEEDNALIVFVDDNESITQVWQLEAEVAGKNLVTFNQVDEFLSDLSYPHNTTFYLDSDLGNGRKGEEIAKLLYDKGYRNIYLATGYEKSVFSHVYYVKDIVGKKPPF